MILRPVIERELREQARRPLNFAVRCGGAGALILICFWAYAQVVARTSWGGWGGWPGRAGPGGSGFQGPALFAVLHYVVFCGVWIFGPLLTADCLAREKREGTLGLLFLTPLKARDIVLAKWLSHGLRLFTLVLVAAPVILVPVLWGGVSWMDGARSLLLNLSAMFLALSAGMAASALSREWVRAMILAILLGLLLALAFAFGHLLVHVGWSAWTTGHLEVTRVGSLLDRYADKLQSVARLLEGDVGGVALTTLSAPATVTTVWLSAAVLGFSLGLTGLVLAFAARQVRRAWLDTGLSARQVWFLKIFCSPLAPWRGWFRRSMGRSLQRNPIGWLQRRSWSARLIIWVWCGALVGVETLLVGWSNIYSFIEQQQAVSMALAMGLAFVAVGSFRQEKQTGALELLLVTPLTERQIVDGRLRGIWTQFLPAYFLLATVYLFMTRSGVFGWRSEHSGPGLVMLELGKLLMVPVVGLYYGMRRENFIVALFNTLVVSLLLPWIVLAIVGLPFGLMMGILIDINLGRFRIGNLENVRIPAVAYVLICAVVAWRYRSSLIRDFARRRFRFR